MANNNPNREKAMKNGIYLLANDNVYDQVVALLNSIKSNYSQDIPVCIIPFNKNIDLIEKEIVKRKNVFLFENKNSIEKWVNFITEVHQIYYGRLSEIKSKKTQVLNMHKKYCAFDGPFENFIYIDSDTLVFQPLDHIFSKLEEYDFVVHDFQRKTAIKKGTVSNFFEVFKNVHESESALANRIHCSGFWASKQNLINEKDLDGFIKGLANDEVKIFGEWLSEQRILNYMTLKKQFNLYNFTLDEKSEYKTGVCVTSPHFEDKNHILYDQEKKLTYLHYMGVKNDRFERLCQVAKLNLPFKNIYIKLADKFLDWKISSIPYKNVFLYYRFLQETGKA
ncbi:sugar transferase [Coleofasciculus sp. FACHB-64]|uniref:Npun_R2821/Npun_R2822 family protein n=1 Tax=Cyanophyceae TaxID=3028117 RepID=UPI0016889680|nr:MULTISPECIES: Npun_R2821/Npun_R2822 family protein [unclassified Coleofasciculus]MBD1840085.1 sugar transferase [Coleofasciculus sp. FACHB-501]MBD2044884.1 sugar transferase [Coleofasciculus sp. FACHB-64]